MADEPAADGVTLYWLPLGAGGRFGVVRASGRAYEALLARRDHRPRRALYHCALEVRHDGDRYVIESAPVWGNPDPERGVVAEGPVGFRLLGRSRFFRYEVRRWRGGAIPDVGFAVGGPRRVGTDPARVARLLRLVPAVPTATWGRDDVRAGDMWNSNSMIAWLLAGSGHDTDGLGPPPGGRAPGWAAGLVVAGRAAAADPVP